MKITTKQFLHLANYPAWKALLLGITIATTYGCAAYGAIQDAKRIERIMTSQDSVRESDRKRLALLSEQTGEYIEKHGESVATEATNNMLKGKMVHDDKRDYRIIEYNDLRLVKYSIFSPKVFCGESRLSKKVIRWGEYVWEDEKVFHRFIASPLDIEIEYNTIDVVKRNNIGSVAHDKACS
jgi:hypothetical protein